MKTRLIASMMIMLFLASMVSMTFIAPTAASPYSNIVGLWHFNEGIGSVAQDTSGTVPANNGTLSGGEFGNGLSFDGSSSYVNIPDAASLKPTSAITVEAWFKAVSLSAVPPIVKKASDGSGYSLEGHGGNISFWVSTVSAGWLGAISDVAPSLNMWHHAAGVYDGSAVKIYLDGILVGSAGTSGAIKNAANDLQIGRDANLGRYFEGVIDEVRISNISRSSFDLTQALSPDGNTVGLWHFDESVGTTAYDSSLVVPPNNGAIIGASWAGPVWTAGKLGTALSFDGVYTGSQADGDYVFVQGSSSLYMTDKITVEAWIKPTGVPERSDGDVVRLWLGYQLCVKSNGILEIALYRSGGLGWGWWDSNHSIPIPATDFYHVAVTYDKDGGADNLRIYINGTLDAQYTVTGALASSGDLWISPWFWPFKGIIDEVRIWNVALTQDQIGHYPVSFEQTGSAVAPTVNYVVDGSSETDTVPFDAWVKEGSQISYNYQANVPGAPGVQYVLTGTSPASPQSVTGPLTIAGTYKTQYYLTLATSPPGVNSPTGEDWYDAGSSAPISTGQYVDIVSGSSRYSFNNWTTSNMTEIANLTSRSTTVLVDEAKTVTAEYVTQHKITFDQSGVGSDFNLTVVVIDGSNYDFSALPASFWWDNGTTHTFAFQSPLVVPPGAKQYDWASTTGLSSLQSGSITVTGSGSITGNYVTHIHDVAVTDLLAVIPHCASKLDNSTWVFQGRPVNVSVTVLNHGDFNETVTVTMYYNITANEMIGTQMVTLLVGENKTLLFMWNTAGVPYCHNYTITAVATIPADYDPADNTLDGVYIKVRIMGDLNGDGKVDGKDLTVTAVSFASYGPDYMYPGSPPNPKWNLDADINQDNRIDGRDLTAVARNFGKSCSP